MCSAYYGIGGAGATLGGRLAARSRGYELGAFLHDDLAQVSANAPAPSAAPADDSTLLRRIAEARDKAAFVELFGRYAGRIKGVLMRSGASPGQAEEAAQEAMLAIWRKADTFDPSRASASAWIFTIARNRRIDLIRRARRPEPDPDDPLYRPDPPVSPEAAAVVAARDKALRAAVAALTPEQRQVIFLSFYEGLAHGAIAERLDLPLGTVKSRLRLAAGKLRDVLGEDFIRELRND